MEQVARKTYWQIFWRWGYWVPIFWTLALVAVVFYGFFYYEALRMDRVAVSTTATITQKTVKFMHFRLHRSTYYIVAFSYLDLTGHPVLGSNDVPQDFFDTVSVGRTVPFRYDPKDPSQYEIVPGQLAHSAGSSLAIAGFFFGCGLWIALVCNLWARRAIRRRDSGEARQATVTGQSKPFFHPQNFLSRGRGAVFQAHWRTDDGCLEGRTWAAGPASLPPVGTTITIYADPSGKLPSVWEGDCGAR